MPEINDDAPTPETHSDMTEHDSNEPDDVDPEDVEPISESEGLYQRDAHGEFKPLDWRLISYKGETRKFRPYPIPMGDVDELTEMGNEISIDALCEVMADKVHTPDRTKEEWMDSDPALVTAIVEELARMAGNDEPRGDMHRQIRDELADKGESSPALGN